MKHLLGDLEKVDLVALGNLFQEWSFDLHEKKQNILSAVVMSIYWAFSEWVSSQHACDCEYCKSRGEKNE